MIIDNIDVQITKEEIVTEFMNSFRNNTYAPKVFAKKVIMKCLKTLGFSILIMTPALLVSEPNVRRFLFFFFCGSILGQLFFNNGFNELLGTKSFKELILGLERFYWLCDVLEYQVRYLTVEGLLNTDYVYNTSPRLKMLHLIMNGKLDIRLEKNRLGEKHSVYGYNMDKNEKFRIKYVCEPYIVPNEQCTYNLTLYKDYISFHEVIPEQTVIKKKTEFEEKVPKLKMKKDKYDEFRDAYNQVIEATAQYLDECRDCNICENL